MDYTYSEVSPHRREIAPGVINMPNTSRRPSLHNYDERIHFLVYKKPDQASYIYDPDMKPLKKPNVLYVNDAYNPNDSENNYAYDYHDEIDYQNDLNYKWSGTRFTSAVIKQESIFKRLFLSIITTFTTVTNWFMHTDKIDTHASRYAAYKYSRYHEEQRGIFARISSGIVSFFQRIYLLISSPLTVDTGAL